MLLYILIVFSLLLFLYLLIKNKYWTGAITFITLGITLPLLLYLLNWSDLITSKRSFFFDYTFIFFYLILSLYTLISYKICPRNLQKNEIICITNNGKILVPLINFLFIIFYLIENYMGSGTFFPALNGLDIHTYNAPLISYITGLPFLEFVLDYYAYKSTRKKRYLILIILIITIPVITRGSRMAIVSALAGFMLLFLFIEGNFAKKSIKLLKEFKRKKKILLIGILLMGIFLIYYTTIRMNHYGKYNMVYSEVIKYTGPKWTNFLAPYYGYFPLSFNNLNINMLYRHVDHNYLGLYSFAALFFGVLQFDTLFGIDLQYPIRGRYITSVSATVPTGFWDFYFDYGYFCFVPVICAFLICYYLLKRASHERNKLTFRTLYFWYISLWFLMSFQNTIFGTTVIVSGLLIYFFVKESFTVKKISCD